MIIGILTALGYLLSEKDMEILFTLSLVEFLTFDWFVALLYLVL